MNADREHELEVLIRARYPIIYIVSWEERRVEESLRQVAARRKKKLYGWTVTKGVVSLDSLKPVGVDPTAKDPVQALEYVVSSRDSAIFVLKDFHPFLDEMRSSSNNAVVARKLRDIATELKESRKTLVILSPVLQFPPELEKDITVLDYALPTLEELDQSLERVIRSAKSQASVKLKLREEERERVLKAAQGLTCTEAENVFAKSLVMAGKLDLDIIVAEKKQIIRKSRILEYYESKENFDYVGGMAELKEWLRKRGLAFSERARHFGLPEPRGLLLLGVQGAGKSLLAKAVASQWQLPLLKLDMGRVFSELVGSSEQNMRTVLSTAESVAPCLDGESRITLADGSEVTIRALYEDPTLENLTVLGMDDDLEIVPVSVKAITRRSAPDLYEVRLMHGRLRATSNHLHPTLRDGEIIWRRTDELTSWDYVAVPTMIPTPAHERLMIDFVPADTRIYHEDALAYARAKAITPQRKYAARHRNATYVKVQELKSKYEYPSFHAVQRFVRGRGGTTDSTIPKLPETVNEEIGYLLGLIASDGYLGKKRRIGLANTSLELHRIFREIIQSQFGLAVGIRESPRPNKKSALPGTSSQSIFAPCYASHVDNLLLRQILGGIQGSLLSMPLPFLAAWLRGYFDGDGYISAPGSNPKIVLTSKVPDVNALVRSVLRRVGIRPSNPRSPNIEITGAMAVKRFASEIGSRHPEKKSRLDALNDSGTRWDASRTDLIPVGQLLHRARQEIGMPSHKFASTYSSRISCYERNVNLPSRLRLKSIVAEMRAWAEKQQIANPSLDRLERITFSFIGWSKVVSVKPVEKPEYVYDLVCDGNHTFIANGIVTHNCILWLDELEKGLAGTASSHRSDAGTAARVFGSLLTWMQEKTSPVFVIATANDINLLPPEALRKGRFDEIFFIDLPDAKERQEIFAIHLAKRGRDPQRFDLVTLSREAEGFSGAEIEQVVISGLYDAFESGREMETQDLRRNITDTVPLSQTMKTQIKALQDWACTHARPASIRK